MAENLIQTLSVQKNIPEKIGDYFLDFVEKYEEGDVQLRYEGDENGFFTITIYNSGLDVPDNLEDSIMLSEFENCITVIYDMETVKRLQNVKLLANEPFCFENDKEPKFLSAIFNYDRCFEDGDSVNEISFLFLRSDNGFFNKIRFSVTAENACDEVLEKMEAFLIDWLNYVSAIGETIN